METKPTYEELEQRVKELEQAYSERKQAEEALRETKALLEEAQGLANIGSWSWIVETDTVRWSKELYKITGQEPQLPPPAYMEHSSLYTKESWEKLDQAVERAVNAGKSYDLELEMVRPDGQVRYTSTRGKAVADESGRVVRLYGTVHDVTDRKQAEDDIRKSEKKYRHLFESMTQGVFYQNADGIFLDINDAALEMFGLTKDQFFGRDPYDPQWKVIKKDNSLMMTEEYPSLVSLKTGEAIINYEMGIFNPKQKDYTWLSVSSTPRFRGHEKKPFQTFTTIHDVTDRKQAEEALQKAHDKLEQRVKERTKELEIQKGSLEELNTAMKVLLKKREDDKTDIEDNVMANIKELINPYFEKMNKTELDDQQKAYLSILKSNLNEIATPFTRKMSQKHLYLTPTEIRIANLIRHGTSTKKIAKILNASPRTIETHRKNIRGKIGLRQKRSNLRSYLMSLH